MSNPAPRRTVMDRAAEYLAGLAQAVAGTPKPKRKRVNIETLYAEQQAAEADARRWREFGRSEYTGPPLF